MQFGEHLAADLDNFLFNAASEGHVISLETYLLGLPIELSQWCVNRLYTKNEMSCTLLMIACRNERENVVRMLLKRFYPDLETIGRIMLTARQNSQQCDDVSALWTAAAIGSLSIVKLLVEAGADVNFKTSSNSTPFRCACYDGNLEMARYLVEHGADWHVAKSPNDTNLSLCAHFDHLEVMKFLIEELQYDINEVGDDGRTALHVSVKNGSNEIVKYLLAHGALNMRDTKNNMTPLMFAAEYTHVDIVNTFFDYCSELEAIEARELIGTAFIYKGENNAEVTKGFNYLTEALNMRIEKNIEKVISKPVRAFDYCQESQTLEQLNEIHFNSDRLHLEALMIRERLLTKTSAIFRTSVHLEGEDLASRNQFIKAFRFWLYEKQAKHDNNALVEPAEIIECLVLLTKSILRSQTVSIEDILEMLCLINERILASRNSIANGDVREDLLTMLYLITIITRVHHTFLFDDCRQIYDFLRLINQSCHGKELLRLSLESHSNFESGDDHVQALVEICKYPCLKTIQLLVSCRADINCIVEHGDTLLHRLVANEIWNETMTEVLEYLYNVGIHFDYVNQDNKTAVDISNHADIAGLLKQKTKISLKCICARIIRHNQLHRSFLSEALILFIDKH